MKRIITLTVFLLCLASTSGFAQKAKTEKALLGCWQLTDFKLNPEPPQMAEIKKQVVNTVVCFEKDGKFTSKNAVGAAAGTGTYTVSEDGKSLFQKTDGMPDETPEGKITKLTDKELIFQAAEATLIFTKK